MQVVKGLRSLTRRGGTARGASVRSEVKRSKIVHDSAGVWLAGAHYL